MNKDLLIADELRHEIGEIVKVAIEEAYQKGYFPHLHWSHFPYEPAK